MTIEQRIKHHQYLLVSKCLIPVYLKNKIQYLSDKNPYSLQNVVSEKLQKGWFMMLKVEDTMGKKKLVNEFF